MKKGSLSTLSSLDNINNPIYKPAYINRLKYSTSN